jgi:uroporphyrinogen decarboxylase
MTVFAHHQPDRVPIWCGASEEFWAKSKRELSLDDEGLRLRFGDDFRRVREVFLGRDNLTLPGSHRAGPFGIERQGIGYGQPMSHPLAGATATGTGATATYTVATLAQVHDFPWPTQDCMDISHIRAEAASWGGQYAILGGAWSPFFHDAIDLLGMEGLMLMMYDAPEVVDAVMGHLVDFYAETSVRIFDAAADVIDIFFMGNDYGSMIGPIVSEPQFRRFILPHQERLIRLGHDYGLKTMLHCCGGIAELIPDMLEAGLDAIHAVQPVCRGMDLRELKAKYGDRLVFNGAIDSQHVLIEGSADYVRAETREVLDIMMPGGGYIAGASHDTILEETPVENVLAMFDTVMEYGVYR